jgi:hypothetical protein
MIRQRKLRSFDVAQAVLKVCLMLIIALLSTSLLTSQQAKGKHQGALVSKAARV